MREKTYHLYLNEEERSRVIQSIIELKNNLAAQGRYTDAVDEVLLKVLSARKKNLFRNLQVVWTVQTGLSQMENGKTVLMNQRREILSSLIGKAMVQQTTLVS